jgi:capsular exopolysaccharide synthesis family protein
VNATQSLRAIWGYKWWIAVFAVIAGGAGYFASSQQAETFESSATVQIVSGRQSAGEFVGPDELLQLANVYAEVARTSAVADLAAESLPLATPAQLEAAVTIAQQPELGVIEFAAQTDTRGKARRYAQTYADAFVQVVTETRAAERDAALERIQGRVSEIQAALRQVPVSADPNAPEDPSATALNVELEALQNQAAVEQSRPRDSARILQPASRPQEPASPKPLRDAVLAFLAAFALAVVAAYLRFVLTDRYSSADEAAADLGLPVLGEIPRVRGKGPQVYEPFRTVRTSVVFALREQRSMVVLVTSAEASSGKSFVTVNLAASLALDNRRVLTIDADLRRPSLHQMLGVPRAPGLANVLQGWLAELPITPAAVGPKGVGATIDVMASGDPIESTAEVFTTPKMTGFVDDLRQRYDAVILDSPPVGAVVDAAIIAGRVCDGVVFVVNARATRRRDARHALQTLRAIEVPLLGLVFNRSGGERARKQGSYHRVSRRLARSGR